MGIERKSSMQGNYVLLTADTLRLLLPQHEVGAVEYLDGALETTGTHGLLRLAEGQSERRYVALSAQMSLLPLCPAGRFLVTTLGGGDGLGWCWNELQILSGTELQVKPLPAVLCAPHTPVSHYVEIKNKLAYLCSASRLLTFALPSESA